MTLNIVSSFNGVSDPDAAAYIEAVEAADGELLEFAVGKAINDFVLGCKADGIWDAIKASCILAGARTLNGALQPLVGTAPTNFNFVSGDYNRKTGLKGNGSTKYLNANRSPDDDPQNSLHNAAYVSEIQASSNFALMGSLQLSLSRYTVILRGSNWAFANNTPATQTNVSTSSIPLVTAGFFGTSRNTSNAFILRGGNGYSQLSSLSSGTPSNEPYYVFARNFDGTADFLSASRMAFYSIGESLDLAALDTRVSNLITAIGAAIP